MRPNDDPYTATAQEATETIRALRQALNDQHLWPASPVWSSELMPNGQPARMAMVPDWAIQDIRERTISPIHDGLRGLCFEIDFLGRMTVTLRDEHAKAFLKLCREAQG